MSTMWSTSLEVEVTEEELFAFHNMDRKLFIRLAIHLRRDPSESMQAIGLWIWLEHIYKAKCVYTILSYPDTIVEAVFEETLMAIKASESDVFHQSDDAFEIPILQNIVGNENVQLSHFHINRLDVIKGIGNNVNQVCFRAFRDIVESLKHRILHSHSYNFDLALRNMNAGSGANVGFGHETTVHNHPTFMVGDFTVPLVDRSQFPTLRGGLNPNAASSSSSPHFQEVILPPSERTIFLTFSKGYHITEPELKDFFYRSFGDIIETLYMQEVAEIEQPLYAKLVVRDARAMHVVLNGRPKAKFAINGKHVWARKFVRKNPNTPPSSPTYGDK